MSVNVGSAVGYLDLDISGFLRGLREAESEASGASSKIDNALMTVGNSFTSAGTKLTLGVTTPLVGLGTQAVKTAADFESAMSNVKAISGASASEMDLLSDKAQEMGAKTKFSASEAADAFTYMAMAGWKTESMLDGIEGIMNLAAASGADLAATSDIVTDALTAFGLTAADTAEFVDVIAAASNSANTNVLMLGESFKYAAPVAGAMGYSAQDVAIALGLMANNGIKASQAGTSLRTLITNMANPTDKMAEAMDRLGLSLEDDEGNMLSLMDIMKQLREGFSASQLPAEEFQKRLDNINAAYERGELDEQGYEEALYFLAEANHGVEGAEKAKYAAMLAGKTGLSGLLAVVNSAEEDFNKLTDAIYGAGGTAQTMADIQLDNLKGQITILKSGIEGAAIAFGNLMMPALKNVTSALQRFIGWVNSLNDAQKEQIIRIAAIVASIGPLLLIIGKLLTTIVNLRKSFTVLGAAFKTIAAAVGGAGASFGAILAPILAVVAAIATLGAAFKHLWDTNEEFRNSITATWNNIKATFDEFCQGIIERLNALGLDFENIGQVLSAIWQGFCDMLAPIFEGAWNTIATIFETVLGVLTGLFDFWIGVFTGDWNKAWEGIKQIFTSLWNGILSFLKTLLDTFKGVTNTFLGWFGTSWKELWTSVSRFFSDTWNKIKQFFTDTITSIKTAISSFITSVVQFFSDLVARIAEHLSNALDKVKEWGTNIVNWATTAIPGIVNTIISFFQEFPGKMLEIGYNLVDSLKNAIMSKLQGLLTSIKDFAGSVVDGFKSAFGIHSPSKETTYIGNMLMQGLSDSMLAGLNSILKIVDQLTDRIIGKMYDLIEGLRALTTFAGDDGTVNITVGSAEEQQNVIVYTGLIRTLVEAFLQYKDVLDAIKALIGAIVEMFLQLIKTLVDVVDGNDNVTKSVDRQREAYDNLVLSIRKAIEAAKELAAIQSASSVGGSISGGVVTSKRESASGGVSMGGTKTSGGTTFVFNSPKAIIPTVAAKLLKQTLEQQAVEIV